MLLHLELKAMIEERYGDRLTGAPAVSLDALTVNFVSGLVVELQYLNSNEYSVQWLWRDILLRIDTAPVHPGLATFPNHFHGADGMVKADMLTVPGREPWDNVCRLMDAVVQDPMLCRATAVL